MSKVAFILQTFYEDHIGGAERQVQMLAQALRHEKWKTCYICERDNDKAVREYVDGMDVLALPLRKKRDVWRNYKALRAAMKESGADLFYQRVRHPYTGLSAHIARRLKKPIVWAAASLADTVRKDDLRQFLGKISSLDAMQRPFTRFVEDWGILHADARILQTQQQRKHLEVNYKRTGVVIPNHIVVKEEPVYKRNNIPQALWLSNIKPIKRPELFLELAERCCNLDVRFIMAGACPDRMVLSKIKEFELRNNKFSYLEALEPALAEKTIAEATVLVNTSLFEGFPNAFQQAWYHGVPVLSLGVDPDNVIERIGLGKCAASVEEMEIALRRLLADDQYYLTISAKAREYARATYDLSELLPRYLSIFKQLLCK